MKRSDSPSKRDRFVTEYLVDLNATQAAIRAGFSKKTAYSAGQRLLKVVEVRSEIDTAMAERAKRVQLTADDVLAELRVLALSDVRHYAMGELAHPVTLAEDAPDSAMRAIASVKRRVRRIHNEDGPDEEVEDVEYKLWDKPAALRMAGQHLGLFKERMELSGPDGQALPATVKLELVRAG